MVARVGTGDASMAAILNRQSSALRGEIQRRTTEVTTGLKTDVGKAVGGDFSALAAIDHSLARLRGYAANTAEAGLLTDVMQNALELVSSSATDLASNTLRTVGVGNAVNLDALTHEAGRVFSTAIAALNTRFSERAVFSGVNSETQPLPDADAILSALEAATATATTMADVKTAIDDWFLGPTGYEAAYAGGTARTDFPVGPGEMADMSVTALDPALRATLKDMATMALLGRGLMAGQPHARTELAKSAGEGLMTGGEARAQLMARVGTTQAQIATAATRNTAEESALSIARSGIISADPYEAATRLEELQTQLEALYLITARVSRLSLTEFIR